MRAPRSLLLAPLLAPLAATLACGPPVAARPYPTAAPAPAEAPGDAPAAPAPADTVRYFEREVALAPFVEGFPYTQFMPDLEHRQLYFLHTGDRYALKLAATAADGGVDLAGARTIGDQDWSTRSLWSVHFHAASSTLWLHADAANDEKMNLWRLSLARTDAELEQVTHADYVYGYGFDEGERRVAYLARSGASAPFDTCLRVLTLTGSTLGEDEAIVCDSPRLRFTWGAPRFSPDGRRVFFVAQVDDDRKRAQVVAVDLRTRKLETITDQRRSRSAPELLEGWVDGDRLLYLSNEDGYANLWSYSMRTKKRRQLTRYREDVASARLASAGVWVAHGTPAGTTLELVDPDTGVAHARGGVPGQVELLDAEGDRALWTHDSPEVVFELNLGELVREPAGAALVNRRVVALDPALADRLVRCRATAVRIPSFDRELHAFLLEPRDPLPEGQRLAMVRSFYGGENGYTPHDHILCAAGITVLSPAVRGSSGFGKDFEALNDGDLGGAEIIDLFHAARWLAARTGLPPARIGVYGRSHGGYATLRALTFPADTGGRGDRFEFGFGLAEAGFYDLEAFHRATNIPDWLLLEAGDPAVPGELARLRERSPIHALARLGAPVFLLHGSQDARVPVAGSRALVDAARAAGKRVRYLEVEGQGHEIEGLARIVETYQARFDYLMEVLPASTALTTSP